MNAQELTKKFYMLDNQQIDLKKVVDYIEQEIEKMRLTLNDLNVEIKMLESEVQRCKTKR